MKEIERQLIEAFAKEGLKLNIEAMRFECEWFWISVDFAIDAMRRHNVTVKTLVDATWVNFTGVPYATA